MNSDPSNNNLSKAELQYRRTERITAIFTRFTIVFSALLLIAFGLYWAFHKTKNQKLFYKHFKPIQAETIKEEDSNDIVFNKAINLYNQEKYSESLQHWEEIIKKNPKSDTLHYYTGMAYLAFDKQDPAIYHLNKVLIHSNSIYLQDAYYYLGLANLKADNPLVANKYLSFVENRDVKAIQNNIHY
jgi:tetratricopeptide (TPR) repeat protein